MDLSAPWGKSNSVLAGQDLRYPIIGLQTDFSKMRIFPVHLAFPGAVGTRNDKSHVDSEFIIISSPFLWKRESAKHMG